VTVLRRLSQVHVPLLRLGIGRRFRGNRIVVLSTRGQRSGKRRRLVLVASFGGAPRNPYWFGNLTADPRVEVDGKPYSARVATEEEHATYWPRVIEHYPGYAGYQAKTSRRIPLVVLEPR
jgi:F420H(2)-dependent quinone reductase